MPLRTPLYDWHVAAGARMIEFGGWEMPLQYSGIVEEHLTVRRTAGLFDVSHMGKLLVQGASAHRFLDGLSANDVSKTAGRARYTHLLRDDGTIIDDVIITTLATDRFFVVCNAGPRPAVAAWLDAHRPADVRVDDLTATHLCLALQGPRAPGLLQRFTSVDLAGLKPFWGAALDFDVRRAGVAVEAEGWGSGGADGLLAATSPPLPTPASGGPRLFATRTGYTGEAGFELFPVAGVGQAVWEALLAAGADLPIQPIGLGARDTLRLEKGYLLSGQDFTGRQTPLEVHSDWVVKWDRPFIGRTALEAQRSRGDYPRLVGLKVLDRGIPRHECAVLADGTRIGTVTSGTLSPSLRVGIALASVDRDHALPGTRVGIDIRGTPHPAQVVHLPFL
ncbi:MAG TPA: glycine cleavage system aminomethyltransferase GcvT [Thermoplasmata archaeon]|nr:glycine cleavage system aminomethyltransferase GcvT [Thermoplasmata archaeon]